MAKNIKWSKQAVSDRIQILDYWYKRLGNKTYSKKLDKYLRDTILLLAENPWMGKESRKYDARCFIKGNYQIFYRIRKNCIELLQIWDCRRNPEDLMKSL